MKRLSLTKIFMGLALCGATLPAQGQGNSGAIASPQATPPANPAPTLPASQVQDAGLPAPVFADVANAAFTVGPEHFGLDPAVTPITELTVIVINADGVPRQYGPDASGKILIEGLQPGPVGIVAVGPALHAATAVYVRESAANSPANQVHLPIMRIAPEVVLKHVRGYLNPAGSGPLNRDDFRSWEGSPASAANPFTAVLSPDGTLQGRLISMVRDGAPGSALRDINITLLSPDGTEFRAITDADGYYSFAGVAPGPYGLIAAGPAGYAAHGIEVLPPAELLPAVTPVSFKANQPPATGNLQIVLIPPAMIPALIEVIELAYGDMLLPGEELVGPPFGPPLGPPGFGAGGFGPGGGFGGGSAGGGGGFGGGLGGLAALAPLALLPILIDELDDEEEDFVPPPASPAIVAP